MKKGQWLLISLSVATSMGLALGNLLAHGNEKHTAQATVGAAKVSIAYAAPTLKGRDPMKMIHPGDLWRMGADMPTTLETDADLDFGGTRVAKGKYVLLARCVDPDHWTLVVSTKDRNHYDAEAKVAEVRAEFATGSDPAEELAINLSSDGGQGVIEISWGTLRLKASFQPAR